jgi:hypothetical protein
MKKRIIVVYSSHLGDEEDQKFNQHIDNTIGIKDYEILRYVNHGQYSLPQIYNQALKDYYDKNSIFVFCHNDIIFKTKNWGKILLARFNANNNFDIIGVAGSTYLPESGKWWEDPSKMIGIVEHTNGLRTWVSQYSEKFYGIKEVVLIDGLFMAVNPTTIEHYFDQDFNGFHMYDLSFCLPNYFDGCNIGVLTDIRILHKSIGMTNQQWEENRQKLVNKYKDELPIKLEPHAN